MCLCTNIKRSDWKAKYGALKHYQSNWENRKVQQIFQEFWEVVKVAKCKVIPPGYST